MKYLILILIFVSCYVIRNDEPIQCGFVKLKYIRTDTLYRFGSDKYGYIFRDEANILYVVYSEEPDLYTEAVTFIGIMRK